MRYSLKYFLSLIIPIMTLIGNLSGGRLTLLPLLSGFVVLVLADLLTPQNTAPNRPQPGLVPDAVLVIHVLLHVGCVAFFVINVGNSTLVGTWLVCATVSTGLNSGISGLIVAHELIHRKGLLWRIAGALNLLLVNYGHFAIEHVQGHHRNVGTGLDPATARRGESLYGFYLRTVPGQFLSAWRIESARLHKTGGSGFSPKNFVLAVTAAQVVLAGVVFLMAGALAGGLYLGQSLVAVLLLEFVNYIEHYGLVRGVHERISARHSWQTDVISTRFTLLELSRHSDHHIKASRPYQELESHIQSPVLPTGYFGLFYLALIPPLWFKVMDRRLADFQE